MLRKLQRAGRSCAKATRQAMGCEKTYNDDAEVFSGSESDEDNAEQLDKEQALREIDLLRPDLNAARDFPTNAIRTARYTLFTAIPFSLLYQFHKVSNIFFLLVAVVALVPGASPINPFSSLVPLILVVGAGVAKDLWEDWKRHSADKEANSTRVFVLQDGEFASVKSSDVQVGDVMLYRLGEEVRADCLILNTSLPDGLTYIETANLDGETNAKTRRAKVQTVQQLGTVEDIEALAYTGCDEIRCYTEAMAARPIKGLCARYFGFSCCDGSDKSEKSTSSGDGVSQPVQFGIPQAAQQSQQQRGAGGGGGAVGGQRQGEEYQMCGVRSSSHAHSSSGGTEYEASAPVKVALVDSDTGATPTYLDDGLTDERAVFRPAAHTDSPLPGRRRAYPTETPLGDLATATMSVSADDLGDNGPNAGDMAADEAANNAVLLARSGRGEGLATNVVDPSPRPRTDGVHILASGLNPDLASWFGQVRLPSGELVPVTIDQFLPRGCTVRNTEWVLGIVVYTGRHTKMMLNLRPKPNKTTVLSQRLNQINLFLIIFFLTMMVLVCALAIREKHRMLKKTEGVRTTYSTWYIQFHLERHADGTLFWWRFLTNFVLLSYLIPLSLYVTLEFNKAMQMLMIGADNRMAVFDAFSGTLRHARPKTSELNNQLAQVRYIFTDKTGTLTENLMTYVGGYAAHVSHDERAKPGGLGKVFLTEVIPRLMAQTQMRALSSEDTLTTNSSTDDVHHIGSGTFSVAAATAAVAAALSISPPVISSTTRRAFTRAHGSGAAHDTEGRDGDGGVDDGVHDERDVPSHTPHTTDTHLVAPRDPRLAHKHRDLSYIDESVLEGDELFCYLRALSVCHSVVCFKAPFADAAEDVDGDAEATDGSSPNSTRDRHAPSGESSKHKAKKSTAEATRRGGSVEAREGSPEAGKPRARSKKSKDRDASRSAERAEKKAQRKAKAAKQHRHRQLEQELQSRREAIMSLAAMTPRADGSRVFIPNAVPVDETYEDLLASTQRGRHMYEPYRSTTIATVDDRNPRDADNSANAPKLSSSLHRRGLSNSYLAAQGPVRAGSQLHHPRTLSAAGGGALGSTADVAALGASSTGLAAPLHGHTGSTGWYYSRLHAHSRNATNLSATLGASAHMASNSAGAAALAATANANPIETYIDRTKIYEGQSLDEIALVSAARENGFSLYERTAKQLFVSVLGHIMCYDIIAELEFTPQRKLMSILVRRNPDGDSVEVATAASAASNTHYHKSKHAHTEGSTNASTVDSVTAAMSASPDRHCHHRGGGGGGARNGGEVPWRGHSDECGSSSPSVLSVSPDGGRRRSTATHELSHEPSVYEDSANEDGGAPLLRATTGSPLTAAAARAGPRTSTQVPPTHTSVFDDAHDVHDVHEGGRSLSDSPEAGARAETVPPAHARLSFDVLNAPPVRPGRTLSIRQEVSGASFLNTTHAERPYLLLVKGADSSMLDIVNFNNPSNDVLREPLMADLDNMAKTGLRTLILGQRIVSEAEVKAWLPVFNDASCAMAHRSERMHEAYAMLEKDVDLVGTTAVEDKLQEGVPDTLEFFSKASIIVWMLTGDKRETAITIAQTSGLVAAGFADAMCHLDITDLLLEEATAINRDVHKGHSTASPMTTTTTTTTTSGTTQTAEGGETVGPRPTTAGAAAAAAAAAAAEAAAMTSPEQIERRKHLHAIRQRMVERIDGQLAAAEEQCQQSKALHGTSQCVLVVDGKTLDYIFCDARRSRRFFDLGSQCRSAVCCRMTPLQKSSIVRMFQRNTKAVAVAVGDGANDVSMIQEARIGIGIMGLEGSQAELASDYAIPKFRFLKRLLFVHGRFSQYRDAHCILYSLYKNVLLTTGLGVYMYYCAFSGLSFIDSWLLAMFSVFFCSLQPLMIGILDKDVEDELAETLPDIYPAMAQENMYFSLPYIAKWLLDGLIEGLLFFFFIYYTTAQNEDLYRSGLMGGVEDYGQIFFTMMCLVCDVRVAVIISYYMILFLIAVILELALIPICEIVYAHIYNLAGSNWCVLIADNLYASSKFWLFLLASCGVLAVYTMATNLYVQMFRPWINAGPAMNAMRASPYRQEHFTEKEELMREYKQRLAVQQQRELKALEELERQMQESNFTEI